MEIASLILINILTAGAMYAFFSLKLKQALDKAPRNTVLAELRENVEAAVEYINQAIEIIQTENQTHYRLLNRGDEIVKKLEDLLAKHGAKKALRNLTDDPVSGQKKRSGKDPMDHSMASGKLPEVKTNETRSLSEESEAIPDHLSRILEKKDHVEITGSGQDAEKILKHNEKSAFIAERMNAAAKTQSAGSKTAAEILSLVGSAFFSGVTGQRMPRSSGLPEEAGFPDREQKISLPQGMKSDESKPYSSFKETMSLVQENIKNQSVQSGDEKTAAYARKSERSFAAHDGAALQLLEMIASAATREARQEVIRKMLEAGLDPSDIQRISGFSRAEIDLIRLLSADKSRAKPRRERYAPQ